MARLLSAVSTNKQSDAWKSKEIKWLLDELMCHIWRLQPKNIMNMPTGQGLWGTVLI